MLGVESSDEMVKGGRLLPTEELEGTGEAVSEIVLQDSLLAAAVLGAGGMA
jgi:hypothetical protein